MKNITNKIINNKINKIKQHIVLVRYEGNNKVSK